MRRLIISVGILVGLLFAGRAQATLFDRGSGLIYDDVLNITWLQDANYAKTSGFDSDGLMTWATANTWAGNLVFGGFDDWRLATISSTSPTTTATNCSTATAAACAASGNELGYMYYHNMDGVGDNRGTQTVNGINLKNIQSFYWSGTDFNADFEWAFAFVDGGQVGGGVFNYDEAAWAVRPGDVASVPEPGAWLLMGVGFVGLVAARRRGKI